jgi:cytochrome d ubiquinol oxidase subunit II
MQFDDFLTSFVLFASLTFYVLTGGADYGAGVWNIFVSRRLAARQRDLIATAIQPIWEANHVWLILVVVILFTAYPRAFAYICSTLNVPISIALLGVVMRGTAFICSKYDENSDRFQQTSITIFSVASVITPLIYGAMIGAISAGRLVEPSDAIWQTLFSPWLSPYCICLGLFTLSIFAMLAATYLTVDAQGDEELQLSFRYRAIVSHAIVAVFATLSLLFARAENVWVYRRIGELPWAIASGGAFVMFFGFTLSCLFTKHYKEARILAAGEALIILLGYAAAQYPYLAPPTYDVLNSSAPHSVLRWLLIALAIGALTLFPSLFYLFRIFKGDNENATLGKPLH